MAVLADQGKIYVTGLVMDDDSSECQSASVIRIDDDNDPN